MTLRRISFALLFLAFAAPLAAQDPLGWNSERAHGLIARARERRELPRGDSTLQNYQAKAKGFVYFYLDRREDDERTLVKVDQIALDLYWKRPSVTKQIIVGLRDVSRLPNRMYYHLDHLTVVQNNLGDLIRIGDGDEVRDVPHPAAPGADSIYDYRLADSVTLQLGGGQPDVRVYEVQVRPKRTDRPAFLGSVFVDRDAADIVRMTFTFTPSSYVDRRLDYINISLDNGLFGGKYWLPNEQSVEIRRQLPELDFAAGAVIKGRLSVTSYVFNEPIPDSIFYGRSVSAVTPGERESYPFPEDIYAGVNTEGLAPPPQMEDLRARAAELIGKQRLSGLPAWRLNVPNSSSVLRHTEAEGWYGGAGVTYSPSPTFRLDMTGGYAFGLKRPEATAALRFGAPNDGLTIRGYYNEPRDIGPIKGMPGALNTFSSGFGDTDYTNLYFTRGVSVAGVKPIAVTWQAGLLTRIEDQINSISSGRAYEAQSFMRRDPNEGTSSWGGSASASVIHLNLREGSNRTFGRVLAHANYDRSTEDARTDFRGRFDAGLNLGEAVPQYDFLLGGRETLPGYAYRSIRSESAFALWNGVLSHSIASPWIRLRLLGSAAINREPKQGSINFTVDDRDVRLRASAGAGVGLLWDVLRIDVVKGAHWQTLFSVRHDFWDLL